MFFKKKKEEIDFSNLPKHVAFIMDGNGRWATKRAMPRVFGHKMGVEAMVTTIRHARELGIKVVSFYAFSTENWKREKKEVDEIFRLAKEAFKDKRETFIKNKMRLIIAGDKSKLPNNLDKDLLSLEEETKDFRDLTVVVCLNYGGRDEILRAVNNVIKDNVKEVDEKTFSSYLYTKDLPDPDLVVRTSGEMRISNFLLWQIAYSEFYFPSTFWPDFKEKEFDKAIIEYQKRHRRFGK